MRLIDPALRDFEVIRASFRWQIPEHYNITHEVCDRHAQHADAIALYYEHVDGTEKRFSFGELKRLSNRLGNALRGLGIERGDRVAIVLPQRVETGVAHLAIYRLGAVALPLSILFGPDALEYRLRDSGAKAVITDGLRVPVLSGLKSSLPSLRLIIDCDARSGEHALSRLLERASDDLVPVRTAADDPALLIYTSGTTGPPKGALVAHRSLLGNLTGFELSQNFFPQEGDCFWTPADWAWTGGLMDALLPSWYYGKPVLAYEQRGRFDPEQACRLLAKYKVRNAFIPPTALKMMRQLGDIRARLGVELRSVMSAGEAVGAELYHWARDALGVEVNEMWGQTEFNYLVGNCSAIMPVRPGSMGRPYPGHEVDVIDEQGNVVRAGENGELAARRTGDPVMFLGYWGNEEATRKKFIGEWFCTGDVGYRDEDGYLWFVGRKDDVISSAGYRIGPGEIEDCLLKHPAVAQAAVIGSPDELRGSIVKAFIVLASGYAPTEALKREIQDAVRTRLAAYEYPRAIEFIGELPMTTTGKVRRVELRARDLASRSLKS